MNARSFAARRLSLVACLLACSLAGMVNEIFRAADAAEPSTPKAQRSWFSFNNKAGASVDDDVAGSSNNVDYDDDALPSLENIDKLNATDLRRLLRQAQTVLKRLNTRVAQLQSSRTLMQQVHDAEAHLRQSAEQSVEYLELELARVRLRNTSLTDQLHARDVQIARLSGTATPIKPQPQ